MVSRTLYVEDMMVMGYLFKYWEEGRVRIEDKTVFCRNDDGEYSEMNTLIFLGTEYDIKFRTEE